MRVLWIITDAADPGGREDCLIEAAGDAEAAAVGNTRYWRFSSDGAATIILVALPPKNTENAMAAAIRNIRDKVLAVETSDAWGAVHRSKYGKWAQLPTHQQGQFKRAQGNRLYAAARDLLADRREATVDCFCRAIQALDLEPQFFDLAGQLFRILFALSLDFDGLAQALKMGGDSSNVAVRLSGLKNDMGGDCQQLLACLRQAITGLGGCRLLRDIRISEGQHFKDFVKRLAHADHAAGKQADGIRQQMAQHCALNEKEEIDDAASLPQFLSQIDGLGRKPETDLESVLRSFDFPAWARRFFGMLEQMEAALMGGARRTGGE